MIGTNKQETTWQTRKRGLSNILNLIGGIYQNPAVRILRNAEIIDTFPLYPEARQACPPYDHLQSTFYGGLSQHPKAEKETKFLRIRKKKAKLSLFENNITC